MNSKQISSLQTKYINEEYCYIFDFEESRLAFCHPSQMMDEQQLKQHQVRSQLNVINKLFEKKKACASDLFISSF